MTHNRIARYTLASVNSLTNEATTIVSATFDGAEVGAGTLVADEGNSITCLSHTLQLVVQAGFD